MDEDEGQEQSGLSLPLGKALGGFPARSTPLGTSITQHGAMGGLLKCFSAAVSWDPGLRVQSPVLLGHPAQHCRKVGLCVLSRNSWLCRETARRSGEGRREGTRRPGQVQGRVQASGLIFSGARHLPHGSDSVGSDTIHCPPDAASAHLQALFPLPGSRFPSSLLPSASRLTPPAPSGHGSTHSQPPVKHTTLTPGGTTG